MAAQMELVNCKMQIKTQAGTLDSGKPRVKSYTLAGVDENAGAQLLLDVSGAVGSVIANPCSRPTASTRALSPTTASNAVFVYI